MQNYEISYRLSNIKGRNIIIIVILIMKNDQHHNIARTIVLTISIILLTTGYSLSQVTQGLSQTVRGQVVDIETQTTLPGASVIILNTDPLIASVTDNDGYFRIDGVPLGRYDIEIRFIGYKTYILSKMQVTASKEVVLEAQMQEEAFSLEAVIVKPSTDKTRTINSMAIISGRTFSAEETRRYAGGMNDPARMASAYAGVAVGNVQDNAIIIRGNSPKGVKWKLEGVEIPNPSHFAGVNVAGGGVTTLFSNHLLSNSDFFTGAFPAEYGNALAGVFDIKFRNGNNEKREYAIQAGLMGIDFAAEGPFIKGKKASYLINYRYSTFGLIKNILPSDQIPEYQDLSFKLRFPLKGRGEISLWGIGGNDKNAEPVTADSTEWVYDWDRVKYELSTNVGATGITYKKVLNESAYIHSAFAASTSNFNLDMKKMNNSLILRDSLLINNTESKYTFTTFLNKKFSKTHTNRSGVILNRLFYDSQTRGRYEGDMIDFNNSRGDSYIIQAYSQSKYDLSSKLLLNIGVHAQYFFLNKEYSIEPRLGLKYKLNQKNEFSVGYGNHSQVEPLKVYLYQKDNSGEIIFPNRHLGLSKAHHFILGYDYFITSNLRLKIEPYYQYLYNIPVVDNGTWSMINYEREFMFNKTLINNGTGQNIGIDFSLERFLNNNYYYLMTASLFDSKYKAGNGNTYNSRFNKNYVITILGGKEYVFNKYTGKNSVLSLNGRISVMGGHRTIPVNETLSHLEREVVYDYSTPYEGQSPADVFVDLTISYRKNKKKYSGIWTLQAKNITGSASNYMYQYNLREDRIDHTSENIIVPEISYRIEF